MIELSQKKLGKLIGMKKSDFNEFVKSKQITLRKPRLIPIYKAGDELALASIFLSSFKLIKEFRLALLSESKMQKGGTIYVYSEVSFEDPKDRIDGLILIVKAGTIRDAAIIEVKNGKNELDVDQIVRYQKIAKTYSIPKFITISNQFVSESTQSPITTKQIRGVDMYHFSWSYLLTIAHVLLYKNDNNIEDEDQVEIMREVVNYLEWDKSGVLGLSQMKAGWSEVVDKIIAKQTIKATDSIVYDAVRSWQQQERDMSLMLSRELGVLVVSGEVKYKGKLDERLKSDSKSLVSTNQLQSTFKIKGAATDVKVIPYFGTRSVEMSASLKPPTNQTFKGQLGWIKRQLELCGKKDEEAFNQISKDIYLDVLIKKSSNVIRVPIADFEEAYEGLKGREIREFKVILIKDFGRQFSSPKKFIELLEKMLTGYYQVIVQHLKVWNAPAPKIIKQKEEDVSDNITPFG